MSSQSDDTVFDAFTVEEVPKVNFIEKWRRRIRDAPENIRPDHEKPIDETGVGRLI